MSKPSKGSSFERDIAKFLSKWIQGNEKPYLFWRTPLSGGLVTIDELNSNFSGDIRPVSPKSEWFPFSIECKNGYPKTSFWQHFKDLKNYNIKDFWIQCITDARKNDKYGMLIYKKKGKQSIVGIEKDIYYKLCNINIKYKDVETVILKFNKKENLPILVFTDMIEFFNIIKPEDMKCLK